MTFKVGYRGATWICLRLHLHHVEIVHKTSEGQKFRKKHTLGPH